MDTTNLKERIDRLYEDTLCGKVGAETMRGKMEWARIFDGIPHDANEILHYAYRKFYQATVSSPIQWINRQIAGIILITTAVLQIAPSDEPAKFGGEYLYFTYRRNAQNKLEGYLRRSTHL